MYNRKGKLFEQAIQLQNINWQKEAKKEKKKKPAEKKKTLPRKSWKELLSSLLLWLQQVHDTTAVCYEPLPHYVITDVDNMGWTASTVQFKRFVQDWELQEKTREKKAVFNGPPAFYAMNTGIPYLGV